MASFDLPFLVGLFGKAAILTKQLFFIFFIFKSPQLLTCIKLLFELFVVVFSQFHAASSESEVFQ